MSSASMQALSIHDVASHASIKFNCASKSFSIPAHWKSMVSLKTST